MRRTPRAHWYYLHTMPHDITALQRNCEMTRLGAIHGVWWEVYVGGREKDIKKRKKDFKQWT